MFRRELTGAGQRRIAVAAVVFALTGTLGGTAFATETDGSDEPVTTEAPVDIAVVDGDTVAVALPPVPPTTVLVAVGLPPVPPTTVVVEVGAPPVPPSTIPDAPLPTAVPQAHPVVERTAPATSISELPETGTSSVTAVLAGVATSVGATLRLVSRRISG